MKFIEEKFEILHEINKEVASFLLIAMNQAANEGFDIIDCHIDIHLVEAPIDARKYYAVSFYPIKITSENVMEYNEMALDYFNVNIDANTKNIITTHSRK
ncbi:hypothetical protein PSI23_11655 [Xenorhabdus sp. XENO-10]|uniref:Uncharacterized protein n=1 Tax=Xenorhabdus yunnanensis TaxID=3025878 RepID=A0ABT5LH77_9GAMM|nr:hypothetical protein [Xenorhabdus yunnanensis]MDC9589938.1 hypothetical protein [Xenorhabdus yunnanensis]